MQLFGKKIIQSTFIVSYISVILWVNIVMYYLTKNSQASNDLWIIFPINVTFLLMGIYFLSVIVGSVFKEKLSKYEHVCFDITSIIMPVLFINYIYVFLQRNNIDMRGWWTLFLISTISIAIVYAVTFALLALLLRNHRRYTVAFSLLYLGWWWLTLNATGYLRAILDIKLFCFLSFEWGIGLGLLLIHFIFSVLAHLCTKHIKQCKKTKPCYNELLT